MVRTVDVDYNTASLDYLRKLVDGEREYFPKVYLAELDLFYHKSRPFSHILKVVLFTDELELLRKINQWNKVTEWKYVLGARII